MTTPTQGGETQEIQIPKSGAQVSQDDSIQYGQLEGTSHSLPKEWRYGNFHPQKLIIGDPILGARTKSSFNKICDSQAFVSQIEPKYFLVKNVEY